VIAEPLNTEPKRVASTTLDGELPWQNSTVLEGDVPAAVVSLKREDGDDIDVGSLELVRTLLENGLVDELRLMIDPVVLGGGKRFFSDDGAMRSFWLADSEVTSTGAILATYAAAG
jgi:dihydrofolate reductase